MKKPKKTKLSPSKSKYKGIKKSRSNTSGRSGKAKVEGEKKTQAARRRAAGKKTKPTASKQRVAKGLPFKRSALNPRNPTQLPETDLTKKGLTLRKLIRGTPRLMINNAHDVDVVSLEKTFTVSGMPAIQSVTLTNDPWRPNKIKRPHDTFIIGLDRDADNNPDIKTPINKHKRVICSCACVTGDTRVLTSKGWKTIYEIADVMDMESFPIKYKVDGKLYEGTSPFNNGKKPVYRMTYSNGNHVEATKDHRFLVKPVRGEPTWKELKDIHIGDNLVLTKNCGTHLPEKTEEFYRLRFLGFMQGDGTVTGGPESKNFDLKVYTKDKLSFIRRFAPLGVLKSIKAKFRTNKFNGGKDKYASVSFNIHATELAHRYEYDNTGTPCFHTKEQFFGYLSGLLSADGSVSSKDGKILSVLLRGDQTYIRPVFDALVRYGYSDSSIRLERKAGTVVGILTARKDMYCLKISARTFKSLRDYLELSSRFYDYEFKEFREIQSITKVIDKYYTGGSKQVYDIYVPEINRFVVDGGVVAHNCENYVYTWEYANAMHGASRIIYGNGDAPTMTNPQNAYGLCKHLVALSLKVIKANK